MQCDLDNMVTYLLRGHLSSRGLPEEDVQALKVVPCEAGSGEHLSTVRCKDKEGQSRELRKFLDMGEVNELVNDPAQLDNLADDVRRVREN